MTYRRSHHATRLVSIAIALLMLAACTITDEQGSLDSSGIPQSGEWAVIGAAAEVNAAQLAANASTASGRTAIDYRLRAADQYLLAGRYDLANNQLAELDENTLATTNKTRYSTLRGRMKLPPVKRSDSGFSTSDVAQRLAKRSNSLSARGFDEAAVKLRVLRSTLVSGENKQANNEAIWNLVSRFSSSELATLPADATDELVGWWSLGYLKASREPDELASSYRWWKQGYPGYASNNRVFEKLSGDKLSGSTDNMAGEFGIDNGGVMTVEIDPAPSNVALLLPVSGRYAPAAKAIEMGFRAADDAADRPISIVQIIDSVTNDITAAYNEALINGAQLVIGPLQKPAVAQLAQSGVVNTPLLTLNDPEETRPVTAENAAVAYQPMADPLEPVMNELLANQANELPPSLIVFGLSPEQEAKQVALRAIADGKLSAAVLMPKNDWGSRVGEAFREAFEQAGGTVVADGPYTPGTNDLGRDVAALLGANSREPLWRDVGGFDSANRSIYEGDLRKQRPWTADRNQIDMIFMAAFPRDARILKPSLRFHQAIRLPVYATSHVYSGRPNPRFDADLDGITFCDMPTMLQAAINPDQNVNTDLLRYPPRLVALGRDARLLVDNLSIMQLDDTRQLMGATGTLRMVGNRIERQIPCATFEDGVLMPLDVSTEGDMPDALEQLQRSF